MPRYELGDPDLDARIRSLAADAVKDHPHDHQDADLVTEMIVTALKLSRDNAELQELRRQRTIIAGELAALEMQNRDCT